MGCVGGGGEGGGAMDSTEAGAEGAGTVAPADVDNAGGFGMESGVTITVWSRREFGRFLLRARADARRQQVEAKERDKKKSRRSLNSLSEEEMIRKALEQSLQ